MGKKLKKEKKIMVKIVATTSLPVDRLTATDCNAAARANFINLVIIQSIYHFKSCSIQAVHILGGPSFSMVASTHSLYTAVSAYTP